MRAPVFAQESDGKSVNCSNVLEPWHRDVPQVKDQGEWLPFCLNSTLARIRGVIYCLFKRLALFSWLQSRMLFLALPPCIPTTWPKTVIHSQPLHSLTSTLCLLFQAGHGTSQTLFPIWTHLMATWFETEKWSRSWAVMVKDKQGHLASPKQPFFTPCFPCTWPGLPAHSSFRPSTRHRVTACKVAYYKGMANCVDVVSQTLASIAFPY